MKLIFCPACQDVRKLFERSNNGGYTTQCQCGASWGHYLEDGDHAVVGGKAIPLGFANSSFASSLLDGSYREPVNDLGHGVRFTAFFIPESSNKIRRSKKRSANKKST